MKYNDMFADIYKIKRILWLKYIHFLLDFKFRK